MQHKQPYVFFLFFFCVYFQLRLPATVNHTITLGTAGSRRYWFWVLSSWLLLMRQFFYNQLMKLARSVELKISAPNNWTAFVLLRSNSRFTNAFILSDAIWFPRCLHSCRGDIVKPNQLILVHESGSFFFLSSDVMLKLYLCLFVWWLECVLSGGCIWRQQLVVPGGTNTGIQHKKNLKTVTYPVRAPSCYPPRFNTACLRFFTAASQVCDTSWRQVSRNEGDPVKRGRLYICLQQPDTPVINTMSSKTSHREVWFLITGSISQKSTNWFFHNTRRKMLGNTESSGSSTVISSWWETDGKLFMQLCP